MFWRRVPAPGSQQERSGVGSDGAWRRGTVRHRDSARSGSRRDRQTASTGLSSLPSGGGPMTLDTFTASYLEAALWSTMDESTPEGGEPMDANFGLTDLSPETLERIKADCAAFQTQNWNDIQD